MTRLRPYVPTGISIVVVLAVMAASCVCLSTSLGQQAPSGAQAAFEHAYYLQTHKGDTAAAAEAYKQVADDRNAPEALRAEATRRLAECREDAASADLAKLMPADAIAYVEIARPGDHVERVLGMLGLLTTPGAEPAAKPGEGIPLGDGLFLPRDFRVSPALVEEIKEFRGAAVAVTRFDTQGDFDGLAVIHPGESNLLRGLAETGVQVLEPQEPIGGFRTYRVMNEAWVTQTARLWLIARTRDQIEAAVARLNDPSAASLADKEELRKLSEDRKNSLVFAYVDAQQIVKVLEPELRGEEAAIAKSVLDLEHIESLVAMLGTTDDSIRLQAQMNLRPGHRNLAYAMIRTAPLTRESLAYVPQGAAGVLLLGLNPPAASTASPSDGTSAQAPSLMDVGREVFHNINEVAVFVMPQAGSSGERGGPPIPDAAVVFAVKDVAKSMAIWEQFLGLATLAGGPSPNAATEVTIEGRKGKQYRFPGVPSIVVVAASDACLVAGTESAVHASISAAASKASIAQDEAFAPLIARLPEHASKALMIDAGRAIQAARTMSGENGPEMMLAGVALKDLKVLAVTNEAPNSLSLDVQLSGLPNVPKLLGMAAQMMGGR